MLITVTYTYQIADNVDTYQVLNGDVYYVPTTCLKLLSFSRKRISWISSPFISALQSVWKWKLHFCVFVFSFHARKMQFDDDSHEEQYDQYDHVHVKAEDEDDW